MRQIDYSQYKGHYEAVSKQIINQPQNSRRCTDICCTITFIILLAGFLALGIIQISEYNSLPKFSIESSNLNEQFELTKHWKAFLIGGVTSLLTAFGYITLIKFFPQVMVYTMIILTLGLLGLLTLAGLIYGQIYLAISAGVTLLIYLILLACLWKKIKLGIVLIKIAMQFVSEKLYIFTTPLIKVLMTAIFGVFWIYTFNCIVQIMQDKQDRQQDIGKQAGLITYWMFVWLLVVFVFYYMMTFTIATICAHWYYKLEGRSSFITAYKWIFKQFGSLVFGAMLLAVVTLARIMADSGRNRSQNLGVRICLACIRCLLKSIEDLLKVLNHFTVIVITLTGQGYMDGAKSTMGLLFSQLALLSISNLICNFLVFWGMIISLGIPCVISYFYLTTLDLKDEQIGQIIGIIIVISILISTVVYQIVTEAVSCIFIFYAVDKAFLRMNLISQNRFPQEQYSTISNYGNINPYGKQDDRSYQRM